MARQTVVVLGSGPIRIGQGIEFDYSCVHCVWALREMGHRAVILNNNPETVSTDFDTGDALYFEPVTLPDVLGVVRHESADGVIVQFGGQTAINLADGLERAGVRVLGTPPAAISAAEDRGQFDALLSRLGVPRPPGRAVRNFDEACRVVETVGFPVLVRPSFVLGGRAMEIVHDPAELERVYRQADEANPGQPVLVDKYLYGTEVELDVVCDGVETLVPGIMEHIDRAGIHSGDSMTVYPPVGLARDVEWRVVEVAGKIARALGVQGLMNVQFVVDADREAHVIEVNPRASRTVPYLSKVTGVQMVRLATRCALGGTLGEMGFGDGLWCVDLDQASSPEAARVRGRTVGREEYLRGGVRQAGLFAVKAPVFSFQKLGEVDPALGPEMKSTGEVLGVDFAYEAALYKALVASGVGFKPRGQVILTVADEDKPAAVRMGRRLHERGYTIGATRGTHRALAEAGVPSERLGKVQEGSPNLLERLFEGRVSLMVNTPGRGAQSSIEAARIRRTCIETGVACVTSIDTAEALASALELFEDPGRASCLTVSEYLRPSG